MINMRDGENSIQGLKDLISCLPNNIIIGEIGCYTGQSTEIFIYSGKIQTMYCIDPWESGYDDTDVASRSNMVDVESEFDKRILAVYDNVVKVKKSSHDAVLDFDDEFFDVIYIDGNHLYDAVIKDITLYLPKIKSNGIICGHDYWNDNCDPKKAVDKIFGKPDKVFTDSSWLIYKN